MEGKEKQSLWLEQALNPFLSPGGSQSRRFLVGDLTAASAAWLPLLRSLHVPGNFLNVGMATGRQAVGT